MQSKKCVDCGLVNFSSAKVCKRCNKNLSQTTPNQKSKRTKLSTSCPSCDSTDTKSLEMAYKIGTSFGNVSVASLNDELGVSVSNGSFSTQTILANQIKPPIEPSSVGELIIVLIFIAIILFIGFYIIGVELPVFFKDTAYIMSVISVLVSVFGISALILIFFYRRESKVSKQRQTEYKKDLSQWLKSWICLRCGKKWVI